MKAKILILDNLKEHIDLFIHLLTNNNYEVVLANNNQELFDFIENCTKKIELILIDIMFSNHNEFSIIKQIKESEKGKDIPVVVINRPEININIGTIFDLGYDDYISYPFSQQEILKRVADQIKIRDLEKKLKTQSSNLQKIIPYYQKAQKSLEKTRAELKRVTPEDEITKLSNYHHFYTSLHQEWSRSSRQRISSSDFSTTSISLIIGQINDFDMYKEYHEEKLVKNCLKIVADCLKNTVRRPADLIAFDGKKKFFVLLPNTNQEGATRVGQMINNHLRSLKIPHNYSDVSDYINLIMGIATGIPTQALSADILIEVAEKCLIQAIREKTEGAIINDEL